MLIYPILGILVNMALTPVRTVQQGISEGKAIFQEREDTIRYDLISPQISRAAAPIGLLSHNLQPQMAGAAGVPESRGSRANFGPQRGRLSGHLQGSAPSLLHCPHCSSMGSTRDGEHCCFAPASFMPL